MHPNFYNETSVPLDMHIMHFQWWCNFVVLREKESFLKKTREAFVQNPQIFFVSWANLVILTKVESWENHDDDDDDGDDDDDDEDDDDDDDDAGREVMPIVAYW